MNENAVELIFFLVFSFHLLARAKACTGDFRSALQNEKSAFSVYLKKVTHLFYSSASRWDYCENIPRINYCNRDSQQYDRDHKNVSTLALNSRPKYQ